MIFKAIRNIKNKAIRLGVIWFILSLIFSLLPNFLAMQMYKDDLDFIPYSVSSLIFELSNHSEEISWPSNLVFKKMAIEKAVEYLDEYNAITTDEDSEDKKFINMTEDKMERLNERELGEFFYELRRAGLNVFVDAETYYLVKILSCGFTSFILYLILSFLFSRERGRIDRD